MSELRDDDAGASEARMVRGLQQGDRAAWNEMYDACSPGIWRYVARLVGSDSTAVADVVQETFLAAARSAGGFDPTKGTLWAWLCGIAHHHACGYWRQHAREIPLRESVSSQLNSTGSWTADDPAGPLEQRELAESVRRVLARLPSDYALLLTAKYVDGLSMAEIQRQHGGTLESLRSRLARARREFEAMFERVMRSTPERITTETRRHGE